MSDEKQVIYDDWPYGDRLELRVKPRWSATFVLKWLAAGCAYGFALALVALGVAAIATSLSGESIGKAAWLIAGAFFLTGLYVPLMAEMSYREDKANERYAVTRIEDRF